MSTKARKRIKKIEDVSVMYTYSSECRNVSSFTLHHSRCIERLTQTNTMLTTFFQSDQVRKHKTMQSLSGETHYVVCEKMTKIIKKTFCYVIIIIISVGNKNFNKTSFVIFSHCM